MSRLQTPRNLNSQRQNAFWRQWTGRDHLLEVLPFQKLHHDKVLTLTFAHIMDDADIRMVERRGCTGLPPKALNGSLASGKLLGKELDRDMTPEAGGLRPCQQPPVCGDPPAAESVRGHCFEFEGERGVFFCGAQLPTGQVFWEF